MQNSFVSMVLEASLTEMFSSAVVTNVFLMLMYF